MGTLHRLDRLRRKKEAEKKLADLGIDRRIAAGAKVTDFCYELVRTLFRIDEKKNNLVLCDSADLTFFLYGPDDFKVKVESLDQLNLLRVRTAGEKVALQARYEQDQRTIYDLIKTKYKVDVSYLGTTNVVAVANELERILCAR